MSGLFDIITGAGLFVLQLDQPLTHLTVDDLFFYANEQNKLPLCWDDLFDAPLAPCFEGEPPVPLVVDGRACAKQVAAKKRDRRSIRLRSKSKRRKSIADSEDYTE